MTAASSCHCHMIVSWGIPVLVCKKQERFVSVKSEGASITWSIMSCQVGEGPPRLWRRRDSTRPKNIGSKARLKRPSQPLSGTSANCPVVWGVLKHGRKEHLTGTGASQTFWAAQPVWVTAVIYHCRPHFYRGQRHPHQKKKKKKSWSTTTSRDASCWLITWCNATSMLTSALVYRGSFQHQCSQPMIRKFLTLRCFVFCSIIQTMLVLTAACCYLLWVRSTSSRYTFMKSERESWREKIVCSY